VFSSNHEAYGNPSTEERDYLLAIETSCDDTCICLVDIEAKSIINNKVLNQDIIHKKYHGIVPNLAAIEHIQGISQLFQEIMEENGGIIPHIKYIAVTNGPGLVGSLLIGINFAYGIQKTLEDKYKKVIPVLLTDHLEGHIMVNGFNNAIKYPALGLILSGGHSMLMLLEKLGKYTVISNTMDDAIGECLDKCGRFLGLPYPGGVNVEKAALLGSNIVPLPIPMEQQSKKPGARKLNFSFSGIKTAVYRIKDKYKAEDICCSLQEVLGKSIKNTLSKGLEQYAHVIENPTVLVGGGVIANERLRQLLSELPMNFYFPNKGFSTDSALIPAAVALQYIQEGREKELIYEIPYVYTNIKENKHFSFENIK
jgi:N6-L-threonylcarbamoyladenine synthase